MRRDRLRRGVLHPLPGAAESAGLSGYFCCFGEGFHEAASRRGEEAKSAVEDVACTNGVDWFDGRDFHDSRSGFGMEGDGVGSPGDGDVGDSVVF